MKQLKFFIIGLVILAAAGYAGYTMYINAPKPQTQEVKVAIPQVPYKEVRISTQSIPIFSRGRVSASRVHKIASQVSGLVTDIAPELKKGEIVNADQLLVQIDEQPLILDIAQKKAQRTQTKLRLEETEANARVARRQAGRNASDYARFVPQLAYANSQVEAAEAALQYAYDQLENTKISSPIEGKVVDVFINEGDLVQTGSPVAVLYGMDQAEVRLPLNDAELMIIGVEENTSTETGPSFMPQVTLRDYESGDEWSGYIVRTDGERSANQLLYIIAQVNGDEMYSNTGRYLVPGSFLEAEIRGQEIENMRILPREVILSGDAIWMINADNTIQRQPVTIRYRGKEFAYIDTALPPGTRVVAGNFNRLVEGMTVEPIRKK
ncbi:MAG: efflux RND transporter periplasmic adaptor subunit [Pseudomonadota bacterium]|nr:efflux RND transporter periplasmic adaptor subunit [Pseudomonadota bacterium]